MNSDPIRDEPAPPAHELLAGDGSASPADGRQALAVVAALLDRQARDAESSRAHAREIVRAVEGLAKSQEFLGVQLREERARSRGLLVALCLVPLALVLLGGWMWYAADGLRREQADATSDVERRLSAMDGKLAEDRTESLRQSFDERVRSLESDVHSTRSDLAAARAALDAEREERRKRDEAAAARLAAADRDRAELDAVRAELRAASALAGAERARSEVLARTLADLAKGAQPSRVEASSPDPANAGPAPTDPPVPPTVEGAPGIPGGNDDGGGARGGPAAPAAVSASDPKPIRDALNGLLEKASGPAVYRIESLTAVSGSDLQGLRVTGRDDRGKVLRTIEAPHAEVVVTSEGLVRLRFRDGTLSVGGRTAAFFDGRYGVIVKGDFEAWKAASLPCVRFE